MNDQSLTQPTPDALESRVRAWARDRLSPERFLHTQGVARIVTDLAARYGLEALIPSLRLAAWIHDAAKELPDDALLETARALGVAIRPIEEHAPGLLHGAVALALAREAFGIDDPVVTSAVLYHTTGHPDMSAADKVFYLADLIEPGRHYGWIEQVRALAEIDLDQALLFAVTYQLRRLLKHGALVDTRGIELRNRMLIEGVPLVMRE
ncbi:MAG: bis(5'-nucleosyl)-tetraphosphatase (symmetrical) YqeK [Anaerolineae bacterium]